MNLHVPQTEEARAEAINLMGVKNNLVTPKSGEPLIAAIQDFITASYLLSRKDRFFDRKTFTNLCMFMANAEEHIDLPPPAIWKPQALWTGKQLFNVLIRPNRKSKVFVNLDAKGRSFSSPNIFDDGILIIRGSEVLCGPMDKATVGDGKKNSVFYVILRDYGPDAAVAAMNRLAKLCARWLANQGFSIGIDDVTPGPNLTAKKAKLIEETYRQCDILIQQFKEGKLERQAGCDDNTTLENKLQGILSEVRSTLGDVCSEELSKYNAPLIMATCGSKGMIIKS